MAKVYNDASAPYERTSSFVSLLSGWVQQGLESFFATQRIIVDLALRQNTNAMKSIRQGLSDAEAESKDSPVRILTELAVEGTANYIEAQRVLLDMAQQENEIVMNGVKERVGDYGAAVAMTNVIRRSINTFVEMQQNFLVLASKRTQGWLRNSDEQKDGNGLLELAGEAMEEFIAAQKKFLDVVSEETSGLLSDKREHVSKRNRTELAELGREAADSFIEAQKKLLDLAGQQAHVNMQIASRAADLKMPIRLLPVTDIAGESVKSFVDAEKALVDSMVKSRKTATEHAKKTVNARRQARPAAGRKAKATTSHARTRRTNKAKAAGA